MVRVVVADDHTFIRQGIRSLLQDTGGFEIVGEATDGEEAVALVKRLAPDVVVMDIAMPRLDGLRAAEQLKASKVAAHIVILSMHSDEGHVRQALEAGVRGYVLKRSVSDELLSAIRAVVRGEAYLSPAISASVLAGWDTSSPLNQLTRRERQVLQLAAEGHTNAEIAEKLVLSPKTVEKHRAGMMKKLGLRDVGELIRFAARQGLITLDE